MPSQNTVGSIQFHCIECHRPITRNAFRCKPCSSAARHRAVSEEERRKKHREYMRAYYRDNAAYREKAKARSKAASQSSEAYRLAVERRKAAVIARTIEPPDVPAEALAYAAGIIDGEGCIQIRKVMGQNGEVNPTYNLNVSVNNINPRMIDFLYRVFGGGVLREKRLAERCRRVYKWWILGSWAEWFLKSIRPYLECKGDQADLAILFQSSLRTGQPKGYNKTPADVVAFREDCYRRMAVLHKEGFPEFEFSGPIRARGAEIRLEFLQ